jgi:SAM-dependent methyltransferase
LWQQIVEAHNRGRTLAQQGKPRNNAEKLSPEDEDVWLAKARTYHEHVKERWSEPDASRDAIAAYLAANPETTVLDVGAGTGAWTVFMARRTRHVTAVDPSPSMLAVLRENVAEAGLDNVTVIEGAWPEVAVAPHDVAFCSHALYGVADLPSFVRGMEAVARARCYLLLRVPTPDGVMAEAAEHVWGQPHDSPNFQVAYNALLQMGILADVQMEDEGHWTPWTSDSLADALGNVKRRLGLPDPSEHDAFLRGLLARRLRREGDAYLWPRAMRSALVSWDVAGNA